jgi:hypothetical protein
MNTTVNTDTAAWRLFHNTYLVVIPETYFHNADWIKEFGRPTSGNKVIDKQLLNGSRTVYWSADKIVDVWCMGGSVTFINHSEDPYIVYKDINEHLQDWSRYLEYFEQSLNKISIDVPIDDLINFSRFADALHPLVETNDPLHFTSGRLTNLRSFSRKSRFYKPPVEEIVIKEDFNYNGSHVFTPGVLDDVKVPVKESTASERISAIKTKINEKGHKSFTETFESFMLNKLSIKGENNDQ